MTYNRQWLTIDISNNGNPYNRKSAHENFHSSGVVKY